MDKQLNIGIFSPNTLAQGKYFYVWVQHVEPFVYDNSLTIYEQMGKMVVYLNEMNARMNKLSSLYDSLVDYTNASIQEQVKFINEWVAQIRKEWTDYKTQLNKEWEEYKENLNREWEEYKQEVDKKIEDFINRIEEEWSTYKTQLNKEWEDYKKAMESWKQGVEEDFNEWKTNLETQWSTYKRENEEWKSSLTEEWNQYQETVNQDIQDYKDGLNGEWDTYKTNLDREWEEYKTGLNGEWDTYKNNLNQEWEEKKEYIDNYFANLDVTAEVKANIEELYNSGKLEEILKDIFPSVVTLNKMTDNVQDLVESSDEVVYQNGYILTSTTRESKHSADSPKDNCLYLYKNQGQAEFYIKNETNNQSDRKDFSNYQFVERDISNTIGWLGCIYGKDENGTPHIFTPYYTWTEDGESQLNIHECTNEAILNFVKKGTYPYTEEQANNILYNKDRQLYNIATDYYEGTKSIDKYYLFSENETEPKFTSTASSGSIKPINKDYFKINDTLPFYSFDTFSEVDFTVTKEGYNFDIALYKDENNNYYVPYDTSNNNLKDKSYIKYGYNQLSVKDYENTIQMIVPYDTSLWSTNLITKNHEYIRSISDIKYNTLQTKYPHETYYTYCTVGYIKDFDKMVKVVSYPQNRTNSNGTHVLGAMDIKKDKLGVNSKFEYFDISGDLNRNNTHLLVYEDNKLKEKTYTVSLEKVTIDVPQDLLDRITNLETEVSNHDGDIANAQATADEAKQTAESAQSDASQAQTTASQAQSTASQAQSTAENADSRIDSLNTLVSNMSNTLYGTDFHAPVYYLSYIGLTPPTVQEYQVLKKGSYILVGHDESWTLSIYTDTGLKTIFTPSNIKEVRPLLIYDSALKPQPASITIEHIVYDRIILRYAIVNDGEKNVIKLIDSDILISKNNFDKIGGGVINETWHPFYTDPITSTYINNFVYAGGYYKNADNEIFNLDNFNADELISHINSEDGGYLKIKRKTNNEFIIDTYDTTGKDYITDDRIKYELHFRHYPTMKNE